MQAVAGYFDGNTCIPLDSKIFRPNQRVIITALDEYMEPKKKESESVGKVLDELTGILHIEKTLTIDDIRAMRLDEKYGNLPRQ